MKEILEQPIDILINTMINMDFDTLEEFKGSNKRIYKIYKRHEEYIYKKKIERDFSPCIKSQKDLYYMFSRNVRLSEVCRKKNMGVIDPIVFIFQAIHFRGQGEEEYLCVEGYDVYVALSLLYNWFNRDCVYKYVSQYKTMKDLPEKYRGWDGYDLESYEEFCDEKGISIPKVN